MPAVPVSASTEAALKKLYDEKKAAGEEDDADGLWATSHDVSDI